MKKIIVCVILITVLASCIGQKEEWTVEDWKEHLYFTNPSVDQNAPTMVTGLSNVEDMAVGTHMAFKIEFEGTVEDMEVPYEMTMEFTISGKETVDGVDTVVLDVTVDMDMELLGESMNITFDGKEWVDAEGAPVKFEGTATGEVMGMEVPMLFAMERTGEEPYHGHDCWIYETTQSVEMMGVPGMEMKVVQYMDKETFAIVRMITEMMEEETDSGYIEPILSLGDIEWELGHRETITTDLGTYDCQVIYLKENGITIGTIWANEEVRAPIKYEISYEEGDTKFAMTMTLIKYSLG